MSAAAEARIAIEATIEQFLNTVSSLGELATVMKIPQGRTFYPASGHRLDGLPSERSVRYLASRSETPQQGPERTYRVTCPPLISLRWHSVKSRSMISRLADS